MDPVIQSAVRARAKERCEYCHFPEEFAELPFHCDHIIARQHGGPTVAENLAFACCFCNRFKGPNLAGVDPESGQVVELFNPRLAHWEAHFEWRGEHILGRTPSGRATVRALRLNRPDALAVRALLRRAGVYPAA